MRIDIFVRPKEFYWLSRDLMGTTEFPKVNLTRLAPGKVTIGYANTINETENAAQQIILVARFESRGYSDIYEFANWLFSQLQSPNITALKIEYKQVPIQVGAIANAIKLAETNNVE